MADITKCTHTLCPNAKHCYRIQAKDSELQSYGMFDYTLTIDGVKCADYISMYNVRVSNSTGAIK